MYPLYPFYRMSFFQKDDKSNGVYIPNRSQKLKSKKFRARNKKRR